MALLQYARGIWAAFTNAENPFQTPNGMEENLRVIDDHLALYTLLPPQAPGSALPEAPSDGDGQAFTDGTYATFNAGTWRTYLPRKGIRAVLATGTESWLNTGVNWEQYSVVDTGPATALAIAAKDAAELARDASFALGPKYTTEPEGRAAVGDGQTFLVVGAGDVAAYEYRRINSGASTLIASYPSANLVDALARVSAGSATALDAPNLIPVDWRSLTLGAVAPLPVPEVKNGISSLKVPATYRRLVVARSAISGNAFDASVVLVAKEAGTTCRLLVQQLNVVGDEIAGTRREYNVTSSAVVSPIYIEFKAIAIDVACTNVVLFMDTGLSSNSWWALPTIAQASGNARWRPNKTEKALADELATNAAGVNTNAASIAVLRGAILAPNLIADPYFSDLSRLLGTAPTAVVELLNGLPALKITGTTRAISVPRGGIRGNAMSASVFIPQRTAGANARVLLQQFTSSAEIIGARRSYLIDPAAVGPLMAQFDNVAIDPNCASVRILLDPGASTTWFTRPNLAADTVGDYRNPDFSQAQVYVASTGSADSNPGTQALPVASAQRAISAIKGAGTVILRGGDYFFGFDLSSASKITFAAYPGERVRLILGTQLTGVTKTAGYTKVHQAALAVAPWGQHIFEHETTEGLIPASERHSLQRGRTHRLPSTRIWKVASIAAVEAASRPSWFWSAGVIYFSAADLGDATTHTYYATGDTPSNGCAFGTNKTEVEIIGIESWYGYNGWRLSGCQRYRLVDCFAFGSASNGVASDDVGFGEEIRCEYAATGNDGAGPHNTTATPASTSRDSFFRVVAPWSHDNYDDAISPHERTGMVVEGGLLEYNGDKGLDPAAGSHTVAYNVYSRKNGRNTPGVPGTGQGFATVLNPVAGEGGVGTQLECYGCISEGDNQGFSVEGPETTLRAFNCRTVNAAVAGYYADGGQIFLQDCHESGSAAVKQTINGGTITVSNGAVVT